MERKIGETFEYEGHKLKVTDEYLGCHRCFFYTQGCIALKIRNSCTADSRTDRKSVIFVEVKDEQPQEQAEQPKLNLCEILRDCPNGTKLYSTVLGYVKFKMIIAHSEYPIRVYYKDPISEHSFTSDGKMMKNYDAECTIFPSKEQRDWNKFTAPWYKKGKFDYKKPLLGKVLVKASKSDIWKTDFFSNKAASSAYLYCIPYNDDTKHLVGTTNEAPEFYRYWED